MRTMRLEIADEVARLTLDRPDVLNAGDREWVRDLGEAVSRIGDARGVRVAVITGAGRAFCTGVDLGALARGEFGFPDFRAWEDAMVTIEDMNTVFVAAINGHALGGGLQLALVCDYRLASDAALIGLPAVKEGLIPSLALYRLPRLVGLARARELILLGENVSAREAERLNVVNRVVPAAEFAEAVESTVKRFLALPATTVRASKRLTGLAFDLDRDPFRERMNAAFEPMLDSPEHKAAMAVFRHGRPARPEVP
jgi:enoyl-CoA hydratase/carnithine racemase